MGRVTKDAPFTEVFQQPARWRRAIDRKRPKRQSLRRRARFRNTSDAAYAFAYSPAHNVTLRAIGARRLFVGWIAAAVVLTPFKPK